MDADSFHRLVKLLADSGEAKTIEEANSTFLKYGVRITIADGVVDDVCAQVIALTAINAASRSFLGNVYVQAPHDIILQAPGFEGTTMCAFKRWAGVRETDIDSAQNWPEIIVAGLNDTISDRSKIRPWADGWNFGIGSEQTYGGIFFAPACVAAAGLAVSEAFSILRRDNPYAGRRNLKLSLMPPENSSSQENLPTDSNVPGLWMVGLGHLGQAYAWTLGFMGPIEGATIVLQDTDVITESTLTTSLLSCRTDVGKKKSRIVSTWLESRGFSTSIVERLFDSEQRLHPTEPRMALFGVDNAAARRLMEGAGFSKVIDAGLGSGYKDFRAMRIRTFPGPSSASVIWAATEQSSRIAMAPAYQNLLNGGANPCGVTTLATRAVGAPFVGCVAAGYVLAELFGTKNHGKSRAVIDLNLRDPAAMEAVAMP